MTDKNAYGAAVKILAVSDKTAQILYEKLLDKGYGEEESKSAVLRLVNEGYIKEEALAEKTVKRLFEKFYGREYIEKYLKEKKFSKKAKAAAAAVLDSLDFDKAAEEYIKAQIKAGKTEAQAAASLYKRGFDV